MIYAEPLPLHYSWPLYDSDARFDLGRVTDGALHVLGAAEKRVGRWSCDLADDRLSWGDATFELFGLPHDLPVTRADALALYTEESRVVTERLRAHAIRYRRGFTLDVHIRPATGGDRWLRLVAATEMADGRARRLHGLKYDVSELYRR